MPAKAGHHALEIEEAVGELLDAHVLDVSVDDEGGERFDELHGVFEQGSVIAEVEARTEVLAGGSLVAAAGCSLRLQDAGPWLAVGPGEMSVGFAVADHFFRDGIPLECAAELQG